MSEGVSAEWRGRPWLTAPEEGTWAESRNPRPRTETGAIEAHTDTKTGGLKDFKDFKDSKTTKGAKGFRTSTTSRAAGPHVGTGVLKQLMGNKRGAGLMG